MSYTMTRNVGWPPRGIPQFRRSIPPGIRPAFGQLPTVPATIPGCLPCPTGYVGCLPYCAVDPQYGGVPTMPGVPSTTPTTPGVPATPPVDPASLCAAAGGSWDGETCQLQQAPVSCPAGSVYAPGTAKCEPYPGGVIDQPNGGGAATTTPNGGAAVSQGWWAERTDLEKGLMIAGGGLLAFGLVYAVAS